MSYDDCPYGSCGNEMDGCINGGWYDACSSDNCYGLCDYVGKCDCICHRTTDLQPSRDGNAEEE